MRNKENKKNKINIKIKKNKLIRCSVLAIFIILFLSGCLGNGYDGQNVIETKYEILTEISDETSNTENESENASSVEKETDLETTSANDTETNLETTSASETETSSEATKETLPEEETATTHNPGENTGNEEVENILKNMTLEEKVCQMFVITPEALNDGKNVVSVSENMKANLDQYPVGGIIFFAANIVEPVQTKTMLAELQTESKKNTGLELFTCIDEEGGRVARIGSNKAFDVEQVGAMGNIKSEDEAYNAGNVIGSYLSDLGFNFDFAPDADVITNPANKVIGDRSFGSDAEIVSKYSIAYAEGLNKNNVLSTFKHFPGHGGTVGDTHEGYAFTDKTLDELMQSELVPFIAAADNEIDAVMVAHISVPNILDSNVPCSLSHYMITDVLRNKIGYEGLICTDALAMKAITNEFSSGEAAVAAILAGNDIILMPEDFNKAYEGVLGAVKKGVITEERIDESLRRILKAKIKITE